MKSILPSIIIRKVKLYKVVTNYKKNLLLVLGEF